MAGEKLRSFSQAFFLMLFNGIGGIAGSFISGSVYDYFALDNGRKWPDIWYVYAVPALLTFAFFFISFHYRGKIKAGEDPQPAEAGQKLTGLQC